MENAKLLKTLEENVGAGPPQPPARRARGPEPVPPGARREGAVVPAAREVEDSPRGARIGIGVEAKIFVFLVAVLGALALVAAVISSRQITAALSDGLSDAGTALASGVASASLEALRDQDLPAIERVVDVFGTGEGVSYVVVYRAGRPIAHSFDGSLPAEIAALAAPTSGDPVRTEVAFADPSARQVRSAIDVALGVAGDLGVRVGMDRDRIVLGARDGTTVLVITLGLASLLAAFMALFLTRRAVRPIRRLVVIARKVGRGDLSETAPVLSSDELGVLAHTFNDTIQRLRALVRTEAERDEERRQRESLQANIAAFLDVATAIAEGDLRLRGEVTSDVLGAVVDSINVMVEKIGETVQRVRQAAETVNVSAAEVITTTERMVDGVQTQARDAARVSQQVAELTESVRRVAGNASAAAQAARATREAADTGHRAVDDTLRSMQRIRREAQSLSNRIKSLGDRSMEISEIVDAISTIASQTNLLALNAAIEASGAGEHGARFAVVADEVRKLAEDSSRSAKRVTSLIKAIQHEVQEAVAAMEESTAEVEAGFRVNTQAGEQLREIATISTTSAELAEQISASTDGQVSVAEQVDQAVSSISEIGVRAEQEVMEGRRAAERLLSLTDDLNSYLGRFKLVG